MAASAAVPVLHLRVPPPLWPRDAGDWPAGVVFERLRCGGVTQPPPPPPPPLPPLPFPGPTLVTMVAAAAVAMSAVAVRLGPPATLAVTVRLTAAATPQASSWGGAGQLSPAAGDPTITPSTPTAVAPDKAAAALRGRYRLHLAHCRPPPTHGPRRATPPSARERGGRRRAPTAPAVGRPARWRGRRPAPTTSIGRCSGVERTRKAVVTTALASAARPGSPPHCRWRHRCRHHRSHHHSAPTRPQGHSCGFLPKGFTTCAAAFLRGTPAAMGRRRGWWCPPGMPPTLTGWAFVRGRGGRGWGGQPRLSVSSLDRARLAPRTPC